MTVIERDVAFEAKDIEEQGWKGKGRVTMWAEALIRHGITGQEPFLTKEELDKIVERMKRGNV